MSDKYTTKDNILLINGDYAAQYHTGYEARLTMALLGVETAPLLDELATKDAVIEAQSERIKELERELAKYQPRFKVGDICSLSIVSDVKHRVKILEFKGVSKIEISYLVLCIDDAWGLKLVANQSELSPLEESDADNG